jgi:hypothetical protein
MRNLLMMAALTIMMFGATVPAGAAPLNGYAKSRDDLSRLPTAGESKAVR